MASPQGVVFWIPARPVIFDVPVFIVLTRLVFVGASKCVEFHSDVINVTPDKAYYC